MGVAELIAEPILGIAWENILPGATPSMISTLQLVFFFLP
jgi:hypothetical protein